MPFYFGDYVRDTTHLTLLEHGAYFFLIMTAWQSGGSLPPDPERLRVISKMDTKDWRRSKDTLLAFFRLEDNVYRHKRVDEELATAAGNLEQKSVAGLASAKARAEKAVALQAEKQRKVNERSTGVGTEHSTEAQRQANPSPSPSPTYSTNPSLRSGVPRAMADIWNEAAGERLGAVQKLTPQRIARLAKVAAEDFHNDHGEWRCFVERIIASAFLTGGNERGWKADIDWCLKPANLVKIVEGKYDDARSAPQKPQQIRNGFVGMMLEDQAKPTVEDIGLLARIPTP